MVTQAAGSPPALNEWYVKARDASCKYTVHDFRRIFQDNVPTPQMKYMLKVNSKAHVYLTHRLQRVISSAETFGAYYGIFTRTFTNRNQCINLM